MRNKAQIRMGESITILFVFFLLVIFGFIFYSKIEQGSIGNDKKELVAMRAAEVAQVVSFMPEFQCSEENVPVYNCFDIFKMNGFKEMMLSKEYSLDYYDLLGYAKITVNQTYPNQEPADNPPSPIELYNKIPVDWTKKTIIHIPISLFNATGDSTTGKPPHYTFGILRVETYG